MRSRVFSGMLGTSPGRATALPMARVLVRLSLGVRLAAAGDARGALRARRLPRQAAGLPARRALLLVAARRQVRLADADLADIAGVQARRHLRARLALGRIRDRVDVAAPGAGGVLRAE